MTHVCTWPVGEPRVLFGLWPAALVLPVRVYPPLDPQAAISLGVKLERVRRVRFSSPDLKKKDFWFSRPSLFSSKHLVYFFLVLFYTQLCFVVVNSDDGTLPHTPIQTISLRITFNVVHDRRARINNSWKTDVSFAFLLFWRRVCCVTGAPRVVCVCVKNQNREKHGESCLFSLRMKATRLPVRRTECWLLSDRKR